ncbi:DUF5667 domain-containing protein [Serpentinicella sp. ANB-PHB4]|uniref:DUF5667 domain-containing protein n=1 Tax=Serpentinicella sp. ANB-PHB4 TaxID=3074076 RepID=UPI002861F448|nr:DUF5667 domain-containing protein [Serpentinicella sp. ANB-PHB4]MDR5658853.1 DUF5667 domain-containing protein [Serpentinicella sp. ANB-PHB4]
MKKLIVTSMVGVLLISGTVYADEQQEVLTPESELYETIRLIENNEYELTEAYEEKALLQDEYADRRLEEMEEVLKEEDQEAAERLIEDYNEHIEEINKNLELGRGLGNDITNVESLVAQNSLKRSENLSTLLEREDIPEEAKEGISKAIENQNQVSERLAEALEKASQAREQAEERANEAREQAEERNTQAREQAEERAVEAREQAEERANQGRGRAKEREER